MHPHIAKKLLNNVRCVAALLLVTASVGGNAAVINIATDASWLVTNAAPAATWNTDPTFNTATWINANVLPIPGCSGLFSCIWYDGQFSATADAWFRKTFSLTDPVSSAVLVGGVDDDADVFVNGIQVLNDHNGTAANFGPLDVTALLVSGVNLIAVHATDNIQVFGQNHAFEAALTGNTRVAAVPLPSVLNLFLIGFGGLVVVRRQRRH